MELVTKVAEIIPVSAVPALPDGAEFMAEIYSPGGVSEIKNIKLEGDKVVAKDGTDILLYSDIDQCWLCYNLVKVIEEIKAENSCCMRFAHKGAE